MEIPLKIQYAADRLRDGRRINRLTVRDFLRHFGAERRGTAKVQAIRSVLDALGLQTDPDFETVWIDGLILLKLKGTPHHHQNGVDAAEVDGDPSEPRVEDIILESTPSAVQQAEEQSESAPTSTEPESSPGNQSPAGASTIADPTFRIGNLPAANKKLIAVNQDDKLNKAVTLLLNHDFSQLPVMQGEREVKGMITWQSIGSKQAFGCKCDAVGDCRVDARIVNSNRTLFDAIPIIVEAGYVLVRNQSDKRITGIVTASDLSLQFQSLAEPFLLLREIELHVRQILERKLSEDDLLLIDSPNLVGKKPTSISELTFGHYVRLFQHPLIWAKLNLKIDSGLLTAQLEEVRLIRNDVMHFDQEPMTLDELSTLKRTVNFLQQLFELAI